jgi:hypothetical protein
VRRSRYYQGPSDRKLFTSSLIGLTSGLALGASPR